MPAATRRGLFRSTTSASATLTPLPRTPARGRTAATPAGYGSPVNLEESCTICFSALSDKRSAVMYPCKHRFHSSCGTRWMETRESRSAQTCPLCRTRTLALEEDGEFARPPYPFGPTGQPSRVLLATEEQPTNLRDLIEETQKRLTRCEELEKSARRSEEEFAADIREEKALLEIRRQTLNQLMREFARGEWVEHVRATAVMAELRTGMQQVRLLQLQHMQEMLEARVFSPRPNRVRANVPARSEEPQQTQSQRVRPRSVADRSETRPVMVARPPAAVRPPPAPQPPRVPAATTVGSQSRPVTVARAPHAAHPTEVVLARAAAAQPRRVAPTAAATEDWSQNRPPTVARAPHAARPTEVVLARAVAAQPRRAALTAAATEDWSQNRPPTVARAPHAARPTAAALLRAAAVVAQRAAAAAARDAAAASTRTTASRRNGGVQPVQPAAAAAATRRVTAAAAGPARRRSRLSGVSVTPRTSPRLQQNRGHPEQTRAQATSPPRGGDADVRAVADEDAHAVADATRSPPVPETPRRSARIAARAARAAGVTARLEM